MDTKKTCLFCGEEINKGRSDMKFCDSHCRSGFNNQKLRENDKEMLRINIILRKNRTILKTINPQGLSVIKKDYLIMSGFDFKYFTHLYTAKNGNIYHFCYEYGYFPIDDEKVRIVNWQPYMNKQT